MQGKNTGTTTIIGGTYIECCSQYDRKELFGSGLRALSVFHAFDKDFPVTFITCSGNQEKIIRARYNADNTTLSISKTANDVAFYYENPFRLTQITPRMDLLYQDRMLLMTESDNILVFGMVEADFCVKGKKVVYDPQTCVLPLSFKNSKSTADQLVMCLNSHEAKAMTGSDVLLDQRNILFDQENCAALIIKDGSHGAYVFESIDDPGTNIPVFMTNHVSSIGSGDVFSSTFAYFWFNDHSIKDSALLASKAVACFVESGKTNTIPKMLEDFQFPALEPSQRRQIYLAGPFFSYSQRWLVNEFYNALKQEENPIFSPLHDVGIGNAEEVTDPDIKGLEESSVILAIVEGLDPGTLFEVGYAVAKGKTVIAYTQNETEKALQMLKGTHCILETDFTTAIYKAIWYASK